MGWFVFVVIAFQNVDSNAVRFKNKKGNSLVSERKSEEGMANALRKTIRVYACFSIEQMPVAELHTAAREDLVNVAFGLSLN